MKRFYDQQSFMDRTSSSSKKDEIWKTICGMGVKLSCYVLDFIIA